MLFVDRGMELDGGRWRSRAKEEKSIEWRIIIQATLGRTRTKENLRERESWSSRIRLGPVHLSILSPVDMDRVEFRYKKRSNICYRVPLFYVYSTGRMMKKNKKVKTVSEPAAGKTNGSLVHHHLLRQRRQGQGHTCIARPHILLLPSVVVVNGMSDLLSLLKAGERSVIRDKKVGRRMKKATEMKSVPWNLHQKWIEHSPDVLCTRIELAGRG